MNFPSWVLIGHDAMDGLSLFDNFIEITLSDCSKCERVPTPRHLPCLKVLGMREMDKVRFIGTEFYSDGNYRNTLFLALRRLKFESMKNLREWKVIASEAFPCLKILKISKDSRKAFTISSNITIVIYNNG